MHYPSISAQDLFPNKLLEFIVQTSFGANEFALQQLPRNVGQETELKA